MENVLGPLGIVSCIVGVALIGGSMLGMGDDALAGVIALSSGFSLLFAYDLLKTLKDIRAALQKADP